MAMKPFEILSKYPVHDSIVALLKERDEIEAATIERCAQWHDKQEQIMVDAADLFAAEWHRNSAASIRALKEKP